MSDNPETTLSFKVKGTGESAQGVLQIVDAFDKLIDKEIEARKIGQQPIPVAAPKIQTQGSSFDFNSATKGASALGGVNTELLTLTQIIPQTSDELRLLTEGAIQAGTAVDVVSSAVQLLTTVSGATGVAMIALAAATAVVKKASADLREEQRELVESLHADTKRQIQIRETAISVNEAYLQSEERRINFERGLKQAEIDKLNREIEAKQQSIRGGDDGAIGDLAYAVSDLLGIDTDQLEKDVRELKDEIAALDDQLGILSSSEIQQAAAVNEVISAIDRESDARLRLANIIDTYSVEQIDDLIDANKREIEIKNQQLQELLDELASQPAFDTISEPNLGANFANGLRDNTFREINRLFESDLIPANQNLVASMKPIVDRIMELEGLNNDLVTSVLPVVKGREDEAEALRLQKEAYAEITRTLIDSTKELQQVGEQIDSLRQELADEAATQRIEGAREAIASSLEARIQEAKVAEEEAAARVRESEIRQKTLTSEIKLTQQYYNERIDFADQANRDTAKLNADFMAGELKAHEDYLKQEKRLSEDYNTDRLRSIEDINDNLLDASLNNDVKRFIQIQKEGEKRLRREKEDYDTDTRRRAEDFLAERQQARVQLEQRLKDLAEQFKIEREQRAEAFKQQMIALREQGREQLDQVRSGGRKRILESQRLENELQRLRDFWRQQDEQRRRQVRIAGMQRELQDMMQHQQNLRTVIANSFTQLARQIISGSPLLSGASSLLGGSSYSPPPPIYQTSNTQQSAAGSAGGFASAITYQISTVNVGEIPTTSTVENMVNQGLDALTVKIGDVLNGGFISR